MFQERSFGVLLDEFLKVLLEKEVFLDKLKVFLEEFVEESLLHTNLWKFQEEFESKFTYNDKEDCLAKSLRKL